MEADLAIAVTMLVLSRPRRSSWVGARGPLVHRAGGTRMGAAAFATELGLETRAVRRRRGQEE
jgi:hypothetical protein